MGPWLSPHTQCKAGTKDESLNGPRETLRGWDSVCNKTSFKHEDKDFLRKQKLREFIRGTQLKVAEKCWLKRMTLDRNGGLRTTGTLQRVVGSPK